MWTASSGRWHRRPTNAVGYGDFTDDGRGDLVVGYPDHMPAGCDPVRCGSFQVADFAAAGLSVVVDIVEQWLAADLPNTSSETRMLGFRATAGRSVLEPECLDLDPPP